MCIAIAATAERSSEIFGTPASSRPKGSFELVTEIAIKGSRCHATATLLHVAMLHADKGDTETQSAPLKLARTSWRATSDSGAANLCEVLSRMMSMITLRRCMMKPTNIRNMCEEQRLDFGSVHSCTLLDTKQTYAPLQLRQMYGIGVAARLFAVSGG